MSLREMEGERKTVTVYMREGERLYVSLREIERKKRLYVSLCEREKEGER